MRRRLLILIACVVCAACMSALANNVPEPGVALVIGNAQYPGQPLASAAHDAHAVAAALAARGYNVMQYDNLTRDGLLQALQAWHGKLAPSGGNLFYFAGHGMQTGKSVRLLGVDAAARQPTTLLTQAIELEQVLEAGATAAGSASNLVLLDTCRDNPFGAAMASLPPTPAGMVLAHASLPGGVALDHEGQGLWTRKLLLSMAEGKNAITPPAPLAVAAFGQAATAQHRRGVLPKDSSEQVELTFWDSVKDSTHAGDYEAYLQAYPNGRFAGLARARIERLKAAAPKAETPKAAPAPDKPRPPVVKRPADAPPATAAPTAEPARPASAPSQMQKAGSDVRDCPACPVLAVIAPGVFSMGSGNSDPSEKPPHRVTVEAPFALGRTEVTVEQWNACVEAGACPRVTEAARAPNTPARDISWDDAQLYVKWLSKVTGKPYRLPTEAEWEYAARGGTSTRYWWGDDMRRGSANCKDCGDPWQADGPAPVASFAANAFGLHDMNGSVWEWVEDCWHSSYKNAPADARAWTEPFCPVHVIRGGSWRDGASYMPATTRFKYDGSVRHSQNGFRVARDMK